MKRYFIKKIESFKNQIRIRNRKAFPKFGDLPIAYCPLPIALCLLLIIFSSCNGNKTDAKIETHSSSGMQYTCPMPEDSVFSNKAGKCPKCGMDLIPMADHTMHNDMNMSDSAQSTSKGYTCPMHPQVHSDSVGICPICFLKNSFMLFISFYTIILAYCSLLIAHC